MSDLKDMSIDDLQKETLRADIETKRQHTKLLEAQTRLENARAKELEDLSQD